MPTNDLNLTPSADDIRRKEFATVRRGYDPDQVRDHLAMAAARVEALEREVREAEVARDAAEQRAAATPQAAPAAAGTETDPYEVFAKRFAGLLGTADREAERLVEEAKAESSRIMDEARMDADRIRVDSQARAEEARAEGRQVLEEARAEAQRALSSLASRRQHLVDQLQVMQSRLISAAQDLDVVIEDDPLDLPSPIAEAEAEATEGAAETVGAADAIEEAAPAEPEEPFPGSQPTEGGGADAPDPRYEDLWVSGDDDATDLPDLASIEFDFDEDHASD